jgi:hypothetical protein
MVDNRYKNGQDCRTGMERGMDYLQTRTYVLCSLFAHKLTKMTTIYLRAVYTCTSPCTNHQTIPCTICCQRALGFNFLSYTHYNRLYTQLRRIKTKFHCNPPLAPNRAPNRMPIRMFRRPFMMKN